MLSTGFREHLLDPYCIQTVVLDTERMLIYE